MNFSWIITRKYNENFENFDFELKISKIPIFGWNLIWIPIFQIRKWEFSDDETMKLTYWNFTEIVDWYFHFTETDIFYLRTVNFLF